MHAAYSVSLEPEAVWSALLSALCLPRPSQSKGHPQPSRDARQPLHLPAGTEPRRQQGATSCYRRLLQQREAATMASSAMATILRLFTLVAAASAAATTESDRSISVKLTAPWPTTALSSVQEVRRYMHYVRWCSWTGGGGCCSQLSHEDARPSRK